MKDRITLVARRLLAAIKRRRRLFLIAAVGFFAVFGGAAYLANRYPQQKGFATFRELHQFVEPQTGPFWRGTWYRGDRDGFSYFYHEAGFSPNLELEVPADAWKHSPRFPYTYDRKQWVGWLKIDEEGGLGGKGAMRAWEEKQAAAEAARRK